MLQIEIGKEMRWAFRGLQGLLQAVNRANDWIAPQRCIWIEIGQAAYQPSGSAERLCYRLRYRQAVLPLYILHHAQHVVGVDHRSATAPEHRELGPVSRGQGEAIGYLNYRVAAVTGQQQQWAVVGQHQVGLGLLEQGFPGENAGVEGLAVVKAGHAHDVEVRGQRRRARRAGNIGDQVGHRKQGAVLAGQQFGVFTDVAQEECDPVAPCFQGAHLRQQAVQVAVTAAKFVSNQDVGHALRSVPWLCPSHQFTYSSPSTLVTMACHLLPSVGLMVVPSIRQ